MNLSGRSQSTRAQVAVALVATLVLAACLVAYAAPPAPTADHHALWVRAEQVEGAATAIAPAPVQIPPTVLPPPAPAAWVVLAVNFSLPDRPFRRSPAPARAPPVPILSSF